METKAACGGGCGQLVGGVHQCPSCYAHMHPFCGRAIGEEGFGQPVICPRCDTAQPMDKMPSASPIIAAFDRARELQSQQCRKGEIRDGEGSGLSDSEHVNIDGFDEDQSEVDNADSCSTSAHPKQKRLPNAVSYVHHRVKALTWMIEEEKRSGLKGLCAAAIKKFPLIFNSASYNANINKAQNWWKAKDKLLNLARGSRTLSNRTSDGRKRTNLKALSGRGRRQSEWVKWIHPHILDEFDRLRKAGLKFDAPLLRQVGLEVLQKTGGQFNEWRRDDKDSLIKDKITARWIQCFMEKHRIVLRAQTGMKQLSKEKIESIEREVAFHLGKLQRDFASGKLNEDTVENIDETHFVIDFDNGRTLGFVGQKQIKYADVVSGGEGMTMVVRISGGANARVLPSMMIFTNTKGSHPIHGVPNNVPGVCYRSSSKGWMSKSKFREYLTEPKAMQPDWMGRTKTIFLDNCSGNPSKEECADELDTLNAELRFLPPPQCNGLVPTSRFFRNSED